MANKNTTQRQRILADAGENKRVKRKNEGGGGSVQRYIIKRGWQMIGMRYYKTPGAAQRMLDVHLKREPNWKMTVEPVLCML